MGQVVQARNGAMATSMVCSAAAQPSNAVTSPLMVMSPCSNARCADSRPAATSAAKERDCVMVT